MKQNLCLDTRKEDDETATNPNTEFQSRSIIGISILIENNCGVMPQILAYASRVSFKCYNSSFHGKV
jgi:hypothetical protein